MSWRRTFKQIVDSQNSQYSQRGGKEGVFENIENNSYRATFLNNSNSKNKGKEHFPYIEIHSQYSQKPSGIDVSSKASKGSSRGAHESGVKCLGFKCEHASNKFETGIDRSNAEVLWCGRVDSAVIDLSVCPVNNWYKDERGWPMTQADKGERK